MTIHVTWDWLGMRPALDLANTVTLTGAGEEDLLEPPGEYERWARAEAAALAWGAQRASLLLRERARVLRTRANVRDVVGAIADGRPAPDTAVVELNRLSRAAPEWIELESGSRRLLRRARGGPTAALIAEYARDALRMAADEAAGISRCPAPSCGMFYSPQRPQQRWCSTQCGTRARVARHYRARHPAS